MAGNKSGGEKMKATMIAKYGSEEKWRKHMGDIGSVGGSTITDLPRGFAANPTLASIAGAKGGRISRRRKRDER